MPRQRTQHRRKPHSLLDDIPQRPEWFRHASALTWAEIARRLGVSPTTIRRWRRGRVRPNFRHMKALQDLADSLGIGHLLTDCGGGVIE